MVKAPLGSMKLAISIALSDTPLIYEADGQVDLEGQAYTGDEELTFIGEQAGEQIFAEPQEPPTAESGDMTTVAGGFTVPAVQRDIEEDPSDDLATESPEHLDRGMGARDAAPRELGRSLRERPGGVVVADIGPLSRRIAASAAVPARRWELERYAIEHPSITSFCIDASGTAAPDETRQNLALGGLGVPFDAFLAARAELFSELAVLRVQCARRTAPQEWSSAAVRR